MLKRLIKWALIGTAVIIGLAIVIGLTGGGSESTSEEPDTSAPGPAIEVTETSLSSENGMIQVAGTVKNISDRRLEWVSSVVTFLDDAGNEIDAQDGLIDQDMDPGQSSTFSIVSLNMDAVDFTVQFVDVDGVPIAHIDGR